MSSPHSVDARTHIVLFTVESWGHVRPLCVFVAKLLQTKPVYVTFFTTKNYVTRIETEIARHSHMTKEHVGDLVRVVALKTGDTVALLDKTMIQDEFSKAYDNLVKEEPVPCALHGSRHGPAPPPDAVILDLFYIDPMKIVREKSGERVKIYTWYSAALTVLALYGPPEKGGVGDPRGFIQQMVAQTGRDIEEVAHEVMFSLSGRVFTPPGFPPMYDYEVHPQKIHFLAFPATSWLSAFDAIDMSDGVLVYTAEEYEPAAVDSIRHWLQQQSKPLYTLAPLVPELEHRSKVSSEDSISRNTNEIEQFMDSVLSSRGPQSLLFISFGSVFWPTEPEKIWAVLDVILDKKIPFIMSYGSRWADVPDSVKEKVEKSNIGILSQWAPQQAILAHPVTGWFMSHCGQNSTFEAIISGVPMICWPFHGDQPFNAINLTNNFNVAYELFEVRNGEGLKPVHRTGTAPTGTVDAVREEFSKVIDNAYGEDGKQKRENMKKLQQALVSSWEEGGSSKGSLDNFIQTLSSGSKA
ncbi:UDP-Glycosyltransferase/glycogen phosphorylase [Abortiporus biennis]|nr:UDP-Glycosyltransferase/glycogen phosphorylase [Abortiporus biennis]